MAAKKTVKKTATKKPAAKKAAPKPPAKKKGFDIGVGTDGSRRDPTEAAAALEKNDGDVEAAKGDLARADEAKRKKRAKTPKAAKAPKVKFTDDDESDDEDSFERDSFSEELSPRALELIEFETEVRNAVGHLANEYKGDAQEHEPVRCVPSKKKPGPNEVFRTTESLRVGLTPEEQLARGKLAAVGQQNLARLQSLRGGVVKQIKKLEKLYTARIEALLKTVDEGHADVPVTVIHVIDKATDRVQVIRCDTVSVMSTRDLSLEERQGSLAGIS